MNQLQIALLTAVILVLICGFLLYEFFHLWRPWLRAKTSGVRVSLANVILMRYRKVDPNAVIHAATIARQSGVPIRIAELESAYLRGVDLEKLTLAYIELHDRGETVAFEDLVRADMSERLAEMLKTSK